MLVNFIKMVLKNDRNDYQKLCLEINVHIVVSSLIGNIGRNIYDSEDYANYEALKKSFTNFC